jgi:hypothetical protein
MVTPRLYRLNDNEYVGVSATDVQEVLQIQDHCRHGYVSVTVCPDCVYELLGHAIEKLKALTNP